MGAAKLLVLFDFGFVDCMSLFASDNSLRLLGIGNGALKVLGMDRMTKLLFKVSTTTRNLMIGVTAAASTGIFYLKGYVDPILAAPVAVGVMFVVGPFEAAQKN